jgi:pyrroline-5-carboxylate reductase
MNMDVALTLSSQTLLGAARMCLRREKTPAELRAMVTSPGGTTIEALKIFDQRQLRDTIIEAVKAAARRSRELAIGQ